jgi:Tol biopolymer transport system component/polyisoprenoid-binding protein YceI
MRRTVKVALIGIVVAVVVAGGGYAVLASLSSGAPPTARLRPATAAGPVAGTPEGDWTVAGQVGFVGFRIRERLATVAAPNDVVGRSPAVSGTVTIAQGAVSAAQITVDMRQLRTDQRPRDDAMHDRGLELDRFPTATFRLTRPVPVGTPTGGRVLELRLPGELTLHGVTRPVIFPLQARWDGPTIQVAGSLDIRRDDYGLQVPSLVGFKIEDKGTIELELTLQRKGAALAGPPSTLRDHPAVPATGAEPGGPTGPPCTRRGALPPGGGRLVFAASSGQPEDLWLVGADGSGLKQLTDTAEGELDPTWSQDGTRIAYVKAPQADTPPPAVHVLRLDASKDLDLSRGSPMGQPDWSPDGRRIAYVASDGGAGATDLYVMAADGLGKQRLTKSPTGDDDPDWSPDGRRIAFATYGGAGNQDIAVINADGSGRRRLTRDAAYQYSPAWSPDGHRIAYVRDGAIHLMHADGSGDRRLTRGTKDGAPAWSPDGTRISFVRNGSIYLLNVGGRRAACLATGKTVTSAARWQPSRP